MRNGSAGIGPGPGPLQQPGTRTRFRERLRAGPSSKPGSPTWPTRLAGGADPDTTPGYSDQTAAEVAAAPGTQRENLVTWLRDRRQAS